MPVASSGFQPQILAALGLINWITPRSSIRTTPSSMLSMITLDCWFWSRKLAGRRPRQIWSQGEPENNHFWFPSFDHPNDFVTTEVIATVQDPLQVISNGHLVEKKRHADG